MSRPRAVPNEVIFRIADRLWNAGEDPTARRLGELIRREQSAAPSYTTLKTVIAEWRRVRAIDLPEELPAEAISALVEAIKPFYVAMAAQAQADVAPKLTEAVARQTQAEAARVSLEAERDRLTQEVADLRARTDEFATRRQQLEASLLGLTERANQAEGALAIASAKSETLQRELSRVSAESTRALAQANVERAELRERVRTLEGQISTMVEGRSAIDRRYETLITQLTAAQKREHTG